LLQLSPKYDNLSYLKRSKSLQAKPKFARTQSTHKALLANRVSEYPYSVFDDYLILLDY